MTLTFNLIPVYLICGWGVIMLSYLSCLCMLHNNLRNFWRLNMKAERRPVRVLANITKQLQPSTHWGKKTLEQNCKKIQKNLWRSHKACCISPGSEKHTPDASGKPTKHSRNFKVHALQLQLLYYCKRPIRHINNR